MAGTPGELTGTLILALSQSQAQTKVIEDQARTIRNQIRTAQQQSNTIQDQTTRVEQLQEENRRLRKELDERHQELAEDGHQVLPARFDDLFRKHVDAQAEIYKLKNKLKQYTEKANRRLPVPISSPVSSAPTPTPALPLSDTAAPAAKETVEIDSSPPRKRARIEHNVLQEIPINTSHSRTSSAAASKKGEQKKIAAIPFLAEDGEDIVSGSDLDHAGKKTLNKQSSLHKRLDGLLAAPTPSRGPLNRPKSRDSDREAPSESTVFKSSGISNIKHTLPVTPSGTPSRQKDVSAASVLSKSTASETRRSPPSYLRRSTSGTGASSSKASKRRFADDEPLRAKSPSSLGIHDFKPNPRWLDSHGMSYDHFLHGQNLARVTALAETLPNQRNLTDHEILLDFLGGGAVAETKLKNMTSSARKNLLVEAKLKHTAQQFGRTRVDYDRGSEPVGYTDTDMPGTQEAEEKRKLALQKVREEVNTRYDDAMSGHGRWVFADE